jgi:transcriptional regulator with XRE-family HTH domain
MNEFLRYIRDNDLTHQQFADMCGVDRSTVTKWIKGSRSPSPKAVQVISKKTKGEVASTEASATDPYHKRLMLALLKNGLTIRDGAARLRISRNTLAHYVKGKAEPSVKTRERIYKSLGVK